MKKVAFLVLKNFRQSGYSNDSFDGMNPFAEYVLKDTLERAGYSPEFCSVDTASNYDVVLVSLRSTPQYFAFLKAALRKWKHRDFQVIVGGQGLFHPAPLWEVADYFWYGRAENEITSIVEDIESFSNHWLKSGEKRRVQKCQSKKCYSHEIVLPSGRKFQVPFIGCPNKCYYCCYSWGHRQVGKGFVLDIGSERGRKTQVEIDFRRIEDFVGVGTFFLTGLDGLTEEVRYSVNRRISDMDVVNGILHLSRLSEKNGVTPILKLFHIVGLEGSTIDDWNSFQQNILVPVSQKLTSDFYLNMQVTPFEPMPTTPSQWSPPCVSDKRVGFFREYSGFDNSGHLKLVINRGIMSAASKVEDVSVTRFSEKYREMIYAIALNPKYRALKAFQKYVLLENRWGVDDLIRRYDVEEKPPCWFIEGIVPFEGLQKLRKQQIRRFPWILQK